MQQALSGECIVWRRNIVLSVVLFCISNHAGALVIDFEDIHGVLDPDATNVMPSGYAGFSWSGKFRAMTIELLDDKPHWIGYKNGMIGSVAAYTSGAAGTNTVSMSGELFSFNGAYITSAWRYDQDVTVEGLLDGTVIYSETHLTSGDQAYWFDFDFQGIDMLRIIPGEGGDYMGNPSGSHLVIDNITVNAEPALEVAVDIKPGSCPNLLNVKSQGILPVAILGTQQFDAGMIDPTSIRLGEVAPIRSNYEDVAAPSLQIADSNCIETGLDGFIDLTFKFKTQEIVEAFGEVSNGEILELPLTGVLFDGTPIAGADHVLIRGGHKPFNKADINKDGKVNGNDFVTFAENWLQSSVVEE